MIISFVVQHNGQRWYAALNAVDAYDHKDDLKAAGFKFEELAIKTWSMVAWMDVKSDLPKMQAAVKFCRDKGFVIDPCGDRAKAILAKL